MPVRVQWDEVVMLDALDKLQQFAFVKKAPGSWVDSWMVRLLTNTPWP
jgi:hypothetical protein